MLLEHVTLRTGNLAQSKLFFEKVFDLVERPRPKLIQHIPGHWLYDGESPLVHLILGHGNPVDRTTNAVDHVGFLLENYDAFLKKLIRLEILHSLMDIEEIQERRIFFRTPDGVLLEAVFKEPVTNM